MTNTGIVMKIEDSKAYIFTPDLKTIILPATKDIKLGKNITFNEDDNINPSFKVRRIATTLASVAAIFLIIVTSVLIATNNDTKKPIIDKNSVCMYSIEINPGIEFEINKDNQVINITALNSDGESLLNELDLIGKKSFDAILEIIKKAETLGYMENEEKYILLSAVINDDTKDNSELTNQVIDSVNSIEILYGKKILSLVSDDATIINSAKENNHSISKELLLQYAKDNNILIDPSDFTNLSVKDLLTSLNLFDESGELLKDKLNDYRLNKTSNNEETSETQSSNNETTDKETTTTEESTDNTTEETKNETKEETTATTTEPTTKEDSSLPVSDTINPTFSLTVATGNIDFKWQNLNSTSAIYNGKTYNNFQYYKIVASETDSTPSYPENGYLTYFSNTSSNSWNTSLNNASLKGSTYYYFAVTYVFENGSFTSNVVKAKTIAEPVVETNMQPELKITTSGDKMTFSWTPLSSTTAYYNNKKYTNFKAYKIMASKTNSTPIYSSKTTDLGVGAVTKYSTGSRTITPSGDDYNNEITLESETYYYFAVTYLFEDGSTFTTNSIKYKIPKYDDTSSENTISPSLKVSITGDTLSFNWTKLTSDTVVYNGVTYSGFKYYKVVASATVANPSYPTDGYLTYLSDKSSNTWITKLSEQSLSEVGNYYAITYCFNNDSSGGNGRFTTPGVYLAMPSSNID